MTSQNEVDHSKGFTSIDISNDRTSPSKDYNKVVISRKQAKIANMITEKKPKKKQDSVDTTLSQLDNIIVDVSEMRKKFKVDSELCQTKSTFIEQKKIFMGCITYINTLTISNLTEFFLRRR